jgi:hypothetical protein
VGVEFLARSTQPTSCREIAVAGTRRHAPSVAPFANASRAVLPTSLPHRGRGRDCVEELHPTCRATSEADIMPDGSIAMAALTRMAFHASGRPPTRPGGAAGRKCGSGALMQNDLEVGDGGGDVDDQPPRRGREVDVLVQRRQTQCRVPSRGPARIEAYTFVPMP